MTTTVVLIFFRECGTGEGEDRKASRAPMRHVEAVSYAGPISGNEELHIFPDVVLRDQSAGKETP